MRDSCFNFNAEIEISKNEPAPFCKGCDRTCGLDNSGSIYYLMELLDEKYNYSPIESKVFCTESQLGMFETYGEEFKRNKVFADNLKSGPQWKEKSHTFEEKYENCKKQIEAINCKMIEGSAKVFKENLLNLDATND